MGLLTDEQLQEFLSVGKGFGSDVNNGYGGHKHYYIYGEIADEVEFFDDLYDLNEVEVFEWPSGTGNGYGNNRFSDNGYDFTDYYGCGYGGGVCPAQEKPAHDIICLDDSNMTEIVSSNSWKDDLQMIDGYKVSLINGASIIITNIHGNVAQGYLLEKIVYKKPCFIIKGEGYFAYSDTLFDAYEKLVKIILFNKYAGTSNDNLLYAFKEKFPIYDKPYSNRDFFIWHSIITRSCREGREEFCDDYNINIRSKSTVRKFIELAKEANYCVKVIEKLEKLYIQ